MTSNLDTLRMLLGRACCLEPLPRCPDGARAYQRCNRGTDCPPGFGCTAMGACCLLSLEPVCPSNQNAICQCAPANNCPPQTSCTMGTCCASGFLVNCRMLFVCITSVSVIFQIPWSITTNLIKYVKCLLNLLK